MMKMVAVEVVEMMRKRMMKMEERDRLKYLVEYIRILSSLKGNYHNEIKIAISAIEKEFGITLTYKNNIDVNTKCDT